MGSNPIKNILKNKNIFRLVLNFLKILNCLCYIKKKRINFYIGYLIQFLCSVVFINIYICLFIYVYFIFVKNVDILYVENFWLFFFNGAFGFYKKKWLEKKTKQKLKKTLQSLQSNFEKQPSFMPFWWKKKYILNKQVYREKAIFKKPENEALYWTEYGGTTFQRHLRERNEWNDLEENDGDEELLELPDIQVNKLFNSKSSKELSEIIIDATNLAYYYQVCRVEILREIEYLRHNFEKTPKREENIGELITGWRAIKQVLFEYKPFVDAISICLKKNQAQGLFLDCPYMPTFNEIMPLFDTYEHDSWGCKIRTVYRGKEKPFYYDYTAQEWKTSVWGYVEPCYNHLNRKATREWQQGVFNILLALKGAFVLCEYSQVVLKKLVLKANQRWKKTPSLFTYVYLQKMQNKLVTVECALNFFKYFYVNLEKIFKYQGLLLPKLILQKSTTASFFFKVVEKAGDFYKRSINWLCEIPGPKVTNRLRWDVNHLFLFRPIFTGRYEPKGPGTRPGIYFVDSCAYQTYAQITLLRFLYKRAEYLFWFRGFVRLRSKVWFRWWYFKYHSLSWREVISGHQLINHPQDFYFVGLRCDTNHWEWPCEQGARIKTSKNWNALVVIS